MVNKENTTTMSKLYENLNLVLFSWLFKQHFQILRACDTITLGRVVLDEFSIFEDSEHSQDEQGMNEYINLHRKDILGRFHNYGW